MPQSSEVPNSNWCELEGLKRSIQLLSARDLTIATLVTDRHRQVNTTKCIVVSDVSITLRLKDDFLMFNLYWIGCQMGERRALPQGNKTFLRCLARWEKCVSIHIFEITILRQLLLLYITWYCHSCNPGLGKALDSAAKDRKCETIKLWRPAIVNHLYWTAASTPDGNGDLMEAKWTSLVNHVQDIHEHDTPAFPTCAHPPLEGEHRDKEWLEPGTYTLWSPCSTIMLALSLDFR